MKRRKSMLRILIPVILVIAAGVVAWQQKRDSRPAYSDSVQNVPAFSGEPYVVINNNEPEFEAEDLVTKSYEYYTELDDLGRCGYAMACIGRDIMPTEDRGSIGQVKPSGWQTVKYEFVDGRYLYNRCHLIGYQLTGENANERNLITGTRYLNVEGMLPFENLVADYIKETGNHVLYRVTPIFDGDNLVARGIQMEAVSVEDNGDGVCFHVYVYNHQPGVRINYADGTSTEEAAVLPTSRIETQYILNENSKKFHMTSCEQAQSIKQENKALFTGSADELIAKGYSPCKACDPQ